MSSGECHNAQVAQDAPSAVKRRIPRGADLSHQYLIFLVLTPVVSQFCQYLYPNAAVIAAQPLSVVAQFVLLALATVAWVLYDAEARWSGPAQSFFLVMIVVWFGVSVSALWHQNLLNPTLVVFPFAIFMILLKRPRLREVQTAGTVFAWALVTVAAAAEVLDALGVRSLHYEGWNRTWIRIWDTFPVLFNLIDYGSRWEGPFGNVNYAGPIGAFLVVLGLIQRRISGYLLTATGVLFLFVSDSRSAWIAGLVATLVLISASRIQRNSRSIVGIISGVLAAMVVSIFVLVIASDGSRTGRRPFWASYVEQWKSSPFIGVGDRGIASLIANDRVPAMATHGHNLIIDPLLRYGLLPTLAICGCVLMAAIVAWRADPVVRPSALALLVLFTCLGIAEDLVTWTYLSIAVVPLLFVVMIGDRQRQELSGGVK